MMEPVTLE